MADKAILIQPGPIFWEVFRGAIRAQGVSVTDWGAQHGYSLQSMKPIASGATNGERSQELRQLMLEEIGETVFRSLYEANLRNAGLIK